MKKVVLILAIISVSLAANASYPIWHYAGSYIEFNGNVTKLTVKMYSYDDVDSSEISQKEVFYNQFGKIIKIIESDRWHSYQNIALFEYNTKNQLISESICNTNDSDCRGRYFYYDKIGNKIKELTADVFSSDYYRTYEYFYDDENKMLEDRWYEKADSNKIEKLIRYTKYKYSGNDIYSYDYRVADSTTRMTRETYINGILTEREFDNHKIKYNCEYLENGAIKSHTVIDEFSDGSEMITKTNYTYKYDSAGRLIERNENTEYSGNNEPVEYSEYTYFDKYFNYDNKNNWQRKIAYHQGRKVIIARIFEYFE
ncbi:MAG: hypothetical protein LBV75_04345 [Paludibacter sp.]|jgi:hypothetical protein|nr:hypothetical protein [Paludibacter sp.]